MTSANPIDPGLPARAAQALAALVEAARLGGEIAMRDFASGEKTGARIDYKDGGSPVTSADLAVDRFLRARLGAEFPDAGWLSEETTDDAARVDGPSPSPIRSMARALSRPAIRDGRATRMMRPTVQSAVSLAAPGSGDRVDQLGDDPGERRFQRAVDRGVNARATRAQPVVVGAVEAQQPVMALSQNGPELIPCMARPMPWACEPGIAQNSPDQLVAHTSGPCGPARSAPADGPAE